MLDPFSIFVVVVLVLAVALVFMGVKTVPQGSNSPWNGSAAIRGR